MALPVRIARGQASDPYELARNDFNTMLSRLFSDNGDNALPSLSNFGVDIREENDRIIIEADLPGFQKDDVEITLEDGILTIMAERREEVDEPADGGNGNRPDQSQPQATAQGQQQSTQQTGQSRQPQTQDQQSQQNQQQSQRQRRQEQGQYLLRERRIQRVVRSFTLPANVDEENVEARMENGVLTIILQKREDAKPRRVKVS